MQKHLHLKTLIHFSFFFPPQHCKKVPVIYAWFCFLCSHTYIFEIWLLRNQLLKCSRTRAEAVYMLFLTSSGSKRKNVIVLRRAKTRIYFLKRKSIIWHLVKSKRKELISSSMESLGNTRKLIHNTWASDLCQHTLALLFLSLFLFFHTIYILYAWGYFYLVFMTKNKLMDLTLNCSSICLR